jgi:hypothetical protein
MNNYLRNHSSLISKLIITDKEAPISCALEDFLISGVQTFKFNFRNGDQLRPPAICAAEENHFTELLFIFVKHKSHTDALISSKKGCLGGFF